MWRGIVTGVALALLVVGVVSGQSQRPPATMTDLLLEIRALRADLSQSLSATVRSQVIVGRAQMQEQRVAAIRREMTDLQLQLRFAAQQRERTDALATDVEQGIRSGNLATERIRQLERELADVKDRLAREQRVESELRYKEIELAANLAAEQNRWLDLNSRLDELERGLSR